MSDPFDAVFARLRHGPWVGGDPNDIPQQRGYGEGQAAPSGWLADGSVTVDVLAANAVTAAKIAANTITAAQIAAGTITANEIATNTITSAQIAAGAIKASEIDAGAVTADKIAANTITANEIAANAIATSELAADAVITENILAANVTASRITATISGKDFGANSGTVGAPGFFFDADANTGLYAHGSGIAVTFDGGAVWDLTVSENITFNTIRSNTDNVHALGASGFRFTEVWAVDGSINTSDERLKKDIQDSPLGLDFIRSLRPVAYRWRDSVDTQAKEQAEAEFDHAAFEAEIAPHVRRIERIRAAQLAGDLDDAGGDAQVTEAREAIAEIKARHFAPIKAAQRKRRPGRRQHYGLVAQQVKVALDAAGVDAAFYKVGPDGTQSLAYSELIAPLIAAVQEQDTTIRDLAGRVAALEPA